MLNEQTIPTYMMENIYTGYDRTENTVTIHLKNIFQPIHIKTTTNIHYEAFFDDKPVNITSIMKGKIHINIGSEIVNGEIVDITFDYEWDNPTVFKIDAIFNEKHILLEHNF